MQDSGGLWEGMGLPVRFSGLLVDGERVDEVLLTAGNRVRPDSDGALPCRPFIDGGLACQGRGKTADVRLAFYK